MPAPRGESSMVPCVHCGQHHAVADTACPHCGKPVPAEPGPVRKRRAFLYAAIAAGASALGTIVLWLLRGKQSDERGMVMYGPPVRPPRTTPDPANGANIDTDRQAPEYGPPILREPLPPGNLPLQGPENRPPSGDGTPK